MTSKPRLPSYNIPTIFKLKRSLQEDAELIGFVGPPVNAVDLCWLIDYLSQKLRVRPEVMRTSLLHLQGIDFTKDVLRDLAWRLCGNLPELRRGMPVRPWKRQAKNEWMPMQVVDSIPFRTKRSKFGSLFTYRILAGSACSLTAERFWTTKFCRYMSNFWGFTKPWGKYPLKQPREFVGMRLYGLFTPELCERQPRFDLVRFSTGLLHHNRELIQHRRRVGFACPAQYTHACAACPKGYDFCPVAVHPRSYTRQHCKHCEPPAQAWFDLPRSKERCVVCHEKHLLSKKEER